MPAQSNDALDAFLRPTAASAAALTVVAVPTFMLGAFGPSIKEELGFGETAFGAIFTIGFLASAIGLQFAGVVADRRGPSPTLRAGIVVAGAGALAIAVLGRSYLAIVAFFCLIRIGESMVQPATNTLVSRVVPLGLQGRSVGIKQSAIPFSTALAGFAVPLAGDTIGWEATFGVVAACALPVMLLVPPNPGVSESAPKPTASASLRRLPHLRLLAVGGCFAAGSVITVSGFFTTAAEEAGYSSGEAGVLLGVGGLLLIVSRLSWGLAADRLAFDRFRVVAIAVGVGSIPYLLFATESRPLLVVGTIVVFGVGWSWPGLMLLGLIELHPEAPGAASAVVQTAILVGALASPLAFGAVVDAYGFDVAWYLPFAFALIASALLSAGSVAARRYQVELSTTASRPLRA